MAITATATIQTAWDCKWSRPGYRLHGLPESHQPETLWVCVRTDNRVPVIESDCETCPFWEYDEKGDN